MQEQATIPDIVHPPYWKRIIQTIYKSALAIGWNKLKLDHPYKMYYCRVVTLLNPPGKFINLIQLKLIAMHLEQMFKDL